MIVKLKIFLKQNGKLNNMKKFLKLILKLILKTDWDSFWSSLFFYTMCATMCATIVFVMLVITKNIITKPKCDTNKRVEFIEKCQSRGDSIFACDDLSMDLYCTK